MRAGPLALALLAALVGGCDTPPSESERLAALEAENALLRHRLERGGAGPDDFAITNAHEHLMRRDHLDKYLAAARAAGIRRTVFVASPEFTIWGKGSKQAGIRENLEEILAGAREHPDEVVPFTAVSPEWEDPLAALRADVAAGARGLKLYSGHSRFHDRPLDAPNMMPLYAWAEQTGLPVLWHVRLPRYLAEFERVMEAHPDLNVVVAHYAVVFWVPSAENLAMLRRLLDRYPRLRLDTSLGTRRILVDGLARMAEHRDVWRELITAYPDRFVMGTDMVVTGNREKTVPWILEVMLGARAQLERESFVLPLAAGYSRYTRDDIDPTGRLGGLALPSDVLEKLYETNPAAWLDAWDGSSSEAAGPQWPALPPLSWSRHESLKGWLLVALPLAAWLAASARRRPLATRLAAGAPLAGLALLAVANYAAWEREVQPGGVEAYDVFHYYMGGKYRAELGTERLYACALVADREQAAPRFEHVDLVRDLASYEVTAADTALADPAACTRHFEPARWEAFRADLAWFQPRLTPRTWERVFIDRGTNASPVWHLLGGALARMTPASALPLVATLDLVFLAVALGCVAWAFGGLAFWVALAFLASSFASRWPPIGTALFRYDWVALAVVAVCLLQRGRALGAGAALAGAAGLRLFPVLLFAGVAAQELRRAWAARRLDERGRRLALGFAGAGALLAGAALLDGGAASFGAFAEKIGVHAAPENVSVMRVGLPVAAAWRGELSPEQGASRALLDNKRRLMALQAPALRVLALLFAAAVLALAPRVPVPEAVLLGFALLPLTLQASYYYYVIAVVPVVIHAWRLPRWDHALALALLMWLNAAALFLNEAGVPRYLILAPGSWLVGLYALCLFGIAWRARSATASARTRAGARHATRARSPVS